MTSRVSGATSWHRREEKSIFAAAVGGRETAREAYALQAPEEKRWLIVVLLRYIEIMAELCMFFTAQALQQFASAASGFPLGQSFCIPVVSVEPCKRALWTGAVGRDARELDLVTGG